MSKKWSVTLNTGTKMPAFGLGTWLSKPGEVGAAVEVALRNGYRLIDCAHVYGNEAEVGGALQKCFKEGVCKREDLFITSKLWNTQHAKEDVAEGCRTTLKNLQLDYLNLYLVHWPIDLVRECKFPKTKPIEEKEKMGYNEERMAKTWEGMEDLVDKELTRAIGISNFTITKMDNLLKSAKIVPAVIQVECHPYFQQQKPKEYCDSKGIIFEAYSPLGNPVQLAKGEVERKVFEDPVIKDIAKKHSVTEAQICISFALHRGIVVIPKSVTPGRIEENHKSVDIKLDPEDMRRLREMDKNLRLLSGDIFWLESQDQDQFWDVDEDKKFEVEQPSSKKKKTED